MARYVDLETWETLEGTIAREGDKIIRKPANKKSSINFVVE